MAFHIQLNRFEQSICDYEQYTEEYGNVLLYGSSFFAKWKYDRARRQWAEATDGKLQIINHGFGGASVDELLFYYDRMVRPYKPSAIVFRLGINDVFQGLTARETMYSTSLLAEWAKADDPQIKLIFIGVFDTRMPKPEQLSEMRQYNTLLEAYAGENENMTYLDINPFFYENAEDIGSLRNMRDVFVEDGLHLTDDGYAQMANYLAPRVLEILKK